MEVCQKINKFLEEDGLTRAHRCIIGHNIINFDKKFIHAMYEKVYMEFPADLWLDTLQMTRSFIKTAGLKGQKANLQAACDLFQIKKYANAHNAKDDTRNTYLLWQKLIQEVDYLPFIQTFVHNAFHKNNENNESELDPSLLD